MDSLYCTTVVQTETDRSGYRYSVHTIYQCCGAGIASFFRPGTEAASKGCGFTTLASVPKGRESFMQKRVQYKEDFLHIA
jgi:hypothetical protein